jgi:thymidylate kinase
LGKIEPEKMTIAGTATARNEQPAAICPLLAGTFEDLARAGISYCLLRGYDELLHGSIDGDVDILVAPEHGKALQRVLERHGFLALTRWGQHPHRFFIGYDEPSDTWIKLDVVTELSYGRPIPALRTTLAADCLRRRRNYGPVFGLAAEDEFLTLLLHCLLDKGAIEPAYRARLAVLAREVADQQYIASQLALYFPPSMTWSRLQQAVGHGEWDVLLKARSAVAGRLAHRDLWGTRWRKTVRPWLRFLDRRVRAVRSPGMTVALLAPDGAGKTTLARALERSFYLPTRYIYMGTGPRSSAGALPTTRWLAKRSARPGQRPFLRALGALNELFEQSLRSCFGAYHRWQGRLVIFDRYAVGALKPTDQPGALHKRLKQWVLRQLCPPPDMVIYLDAPADVLYRRKQEHDPELLEQQRQRYLQLMPHVPQMVSLDAQCTPDQVRRRATNLIWRRYVARKKGG